MVRSFFMSAQFTLACRDFVFEIDKEAFYVESGKNQ